MTDRNSVTEAPRASQATASKTESPKNARNVKAARAAANVLEHMSLNKEAEDVRRLCRANSSYRATCRQLYLDNVALRERIGQLEAEKAARK
jgi:hypothetical protein